MRTPTIATARTRTRFNPSPSPAYLSAVEALQSLLRSGGQSAVQAAYADVTEGRRYRDQAFGRAKPAKWSERNIGKFLPGIPESLVAEQGSDKLAAGHRRDLIGRLYQRSGWRDHGELYFQDGSPYALVGHPYTVNAHDCEVLAYVARHWDMCVHIDGQSWYYPGRTAMVALFAAGALNVVQPKEATALSRDPDPRPG